MLHPTPTLNDNLNNRIRPITEKFITDLHNATFLRDVPGGPIALGQRVAREFAQSLAQIISEEVDSWLTQVTFTVEPGQGIHSIVTGFGAGPTGPIAFSGTALQDQPYSNITKS